MAIVLPAIAGKARAARGYVKANLYAFAIGLPLFALLPAVGPWYGYHTAATQGQLGVQNELLALRSSAGVVFELAGVICFPSFHVVWAVLCARFLWALQIIRIPAAILC